eukprot:15026707-Ditylum_brightwellii.AAC.1
MARNKRRHNLRSYSQKAKKRRSSDHTSDDDAMDVHHSDVDQNVIEKPGQSDADLIHDGED